MMKESWKKRMTGLCRNELAVGGEWGEMVDGQEERLRRSAVKVERRYLKRSTRSHRVFRVLQETAGRRFTEYAIAINSNH